MIEKLNKNKITTDWLQLFPDFTKYKTMHIIKRNGCFCQVCNLKVYQVNAIAFVFIYIT